MDNVSEMNDDTTLSEYSKNILPCKGLNCKIKITCHRFTIKPNPVYENYRLTPHWLSEKICPLFVPIKQQTEAQSAEKEKPSD